MKIYATFVLVFLLVGTVLANKNDKDQWREKKEKHLLKVKHLDKKHLDVVDIEENKLDYEKGSYDIVTPTEFKGEIQTHKLKHYFGKKKLFKKSKKYAAGKKLKKANKAKAWFSKRSEVECELQCKAFEACVALTVDDKPVCVNKKELKKKFYLSKKQKKFWKDITHRFQKKWLKKDAKFSKKMLKKLDRTDKLTKDEIVALKNEKREKLGKKKHYLGRTFHKKAKPHHNAHPKTKGPACGPNEMSQMKTRMMGWFHLLHGQDHDARKAHRGSIGKFYRHVSAKKELREYDGEKCQCMKSAMWQFHQMDKNHDDHLVGQELTMLEENTLEPCTRPYLDACDRNGDKQINSDEWCCCFTHVLPPCFKQMNDVRTSGKAVTYMPRCDKEGYFKVEQCKGGDSDIPLTCWCVDYNGNEYKDTAKEGRAHCHKISSKYSYKVEIPLA